MAQTLLCRLCECSSLAHLREHSRSLQCFAHQSELRSRAVNVSPAVAPAPPQLAHLQRDKLGARIRPRKRHDVAPQPKVLAKMLAFGDGARNLVNGHTGAQRQLPE